MKYALGNFYYLIIYFYLLNVLFFSFFFEASNFYFQGLLHNHRKKPTLFIFKSKLKVSWDLQTQQP